MTFLEQISYSERSHPCADFLDEPSGEALGARGLGTRGQRRVTLTAKRWGD